MLCALTGWPPYDWPVADTTHRLEQRIRADFPQPGSAAGVLGLLADLPRQAGYGEDMLASERVQAAIVLYADGDITRLHQMLDLAKSDWRDVLVDGGLANADWPQRLDTALKHNYSSNCLPECRGARPEQRGQKS
jgi:hypothetical protein